MTMFWHSVHDLSLDNLEELFDLVEDADPLLRRKIGYVLKHARAMEAWYALPDALGLMPRQEDKALGDKSDPRGE